MFFFLSMLIQIKKNSAPANSAILKVYICATNSCFEVFIMYLKNRIYHVSVRLSESHMEYLKKLGLERYNQKSNISVVIRSCVERCMLNDKQSNINHMLSESGLSKVETE